MLDIQFIRDNADLVKQKSKQKQENVDIDRLLELDNQRRGLLSQIEELRQQRNEISASISISPSYAEGEEDRPIIDDEQVRKGREVKEKLSNLEAEFEPVSKEFNQLLRAVPNVALDDVPVGETENDNVVSKTVGEPTKFDFEPRSDAELGNMFEYIDKDRAAKVAGARFAYLKGDVVRIQFAIIQYVLDVLANEKIIAQLVKDNNLDISTKPFTPVLPPAMVKTRPYEASGRLNAEEVTYKLADDDLWLNASAEHSLCTMYMDEILDEAHLPIRYIGYSTSFRREAGSYGKDTEGIFRMHQFDKLEMEVFSTPETGLAEHKLLIAIQEYLVQKLGLPYQLIQKCTADIGKPNATGVDINTWMPAQKAYRETHTADYMTDYQARGLKTRVKRADGQTEFVHTNDATAFALGRILKAVMENYQNEDGSIRVPEILMPYVVRSDK
ncbi:MAG TPA: serine--tRNA ligase [Candidatus Saccharimonadales bacterium]|nr:serine--tRNA ligase [Candidatus Saccharimonadales bacterium]